MVAKTKKPKKDIDLLQQDIASFASSLGLSSSAPHSGFDDTDFRKTGPLKPNKPVEKPPKSEPKNSHVEDNQKKQINQSEKRKKHKFDKWKKKKVEKFPVPPPIPIKQSDASKNLPKLPLMKASSLGVWYVEATELEAKVLEKEGKKIEVENYDEWTKLGERLLAQYVTDFEKSRGNSSDIKLLMTTQRSGTEADKVSAFAVLIGENPIANVRSLDALLGMVTSKVGKRHALTGFDTLKELFLSSLLPDRKLKSMLQRPLNHLPESKDGYSLLLFWYWEECLKQRYERFVSALEEASRDMLPILKDKALKTMYHLLMRKSEQERKLLSVLVNKLGDPENKGASNAEYYLSNLLKSHPGMKVVVIDEVDTFLFRPHLGQRAQYHAVNFLTQIHLTNKGDGPKVAKRLVDVYFALFKVLISDAGADEKSNKKNRDDKKVLNSRRDGKAEMPVESNVEMDSRILSALLTGVDRAFPYVTSDEADDVVEVQTPMLFKLVHSKNFNVGIRALMLLDKIASKNLVVSDRFFRAFYSKLLLPTAMNSSKVEMLFGLLNRAMKSDVNLKRVAAFSKRLLQVALQQPPHLICGCLYFLSEVLKARPPLWNMVLQTESVDEDIEHFQDINEDPENELETASTKILGNTDGTVCNINNNTTDEHDYSSDSDVKNDFRDETDDDSDESDNLVGGSSFSDVAEVATSDIGKEQPSVSNMSSLPGGYEPRHREPSYCKAERASWWELMVLSTHVHPSVATMARTLLSGANIVYNGNPLKDLSLTAFLDKFMEKKPKQTTWHGGSEIEPVKKLDTNNHLIGAEILSLTEEDVPPEDVIFHKFYMNKMNSSSKSKEKKKKKKKTAEDEAAEDLFGMNGVNESDEEIGDDVSDDEEIDKMLDSGDISTEADGGYDYDDLDKFADEYDEDLIGNDSNSETDLPSDIGEEEDDEEEDDDDVEIGNADDISDDDDDDDDDDIVEIGDVDDISDDGDNLKEKKRKRHKNSRRKPGTSPFASLEEYDHLLNEDTPKKSSSKKKKILNGDAPKRSSSKNKEILNEDAPKRSNSKKKKILNEDPPKRLNLRKKRRKSE